MQRYWLAAALVAMCTGLWAQDPGPAVTGVQVRGTKRVLAHEATNGLPLKIGAPATADDLTRAREWVESLGLFRSVQVTREGGTVVITVAENPPVGAVLIDPAPGLAAQTLREDIKTRTGAVLSGVLLASDALKMEARYRAENMVVEVDTALAPQPTDSDTPVNVTFTVRQLAATAINAEPLNYVKPAEVAKLYQIPAGTLLTVDILLKQQEALATFPLFVAVDEPQFRPIPNQEGQVALVYPTYEADQPLLVKETVDLVDVDRLRRWVRFSAVDLNVSVRDLEIQVGPEQVKANYEAARERARQAPDDGEAAWQAAYWAAQAGSGATAQDALTQLDEAGRRLDAAVQAGGTARDHLRLGTIYLRLAKPVNAADQLVAALADKPTGVLLAQTYAELAAALAALPHTNPQLSDFTVQQMRSGAEALAALPVDTDLDTLTAVAQFYFVLMNLGKDHDGLRGALQLGAPLPAWFYQAAATMASKEPEQPDLSTPEGQNSMRRLHHLGKLLTAMAFGMRTAGFEVVGLASSERLPSLLDDTRRAMLEPGADATDDMLLPYFLGLNHMLRGDRIATRGTAMRGLLTWPQNERLIDLFVLSCIPSLYNDLTAAEAVTELANAIGSLTASVDSGELSQAAHSLLLAKLFMASYQAQPTTDEASRAAALAGAAKYAQLTIDRDANNVAGHWFLGIATLKGDNPATAIAAFQKVVDLQPANEEARYALALAKIAGGQREDGVAMMQALQAVVVPATAPATEPAAPAPRQGPPAPQG